MRYGHFLMWPWRSPVRLMLSAVVMMSAVFGVLHGAGWRGYTAVFSGAVPPGSTSEAEAIVCGVFYGASYFAMVLVAPTLLLAAGMCMVLEWLVHHRASG